MLSPSAASARSSGGPLAGEERPAVYRRVPEDLLWFSAGLACYLAVGVYALLHLDLALPDGYARTGEAFGVLFSRDPHLAALGLVWPPLPALLEIPLVLVLRPLGLTLLAGPIMSALFGATGLVALALILRLLHTPLRLRILWIALYALSPMTLQDAVGGLSEPGFLCFALLTIYGFLLYTRAQRLGGLVVGGLACAGAFFCRYEALALAAAVVAALAVHQLAEERGWKKTKFQGVVITFLLPLAITLVGWMFINLIIVGNPFSFLTSVGTGGTPDTANLLGPSSPVFYAYHSVAGSILLFLRRSVLLSPLCLAAAMLLSLRAAGLNSVRRSAADLGLLLCGAGVPTLTCLFAFLGVLPSPFRYFVWVLPLGYVFAAASVEEVRPRLRRPLEALLVGVSLIGAAVLPLVTQATFGGNIQQRVLNAVLAMPNEGPVTGRTRDLEEFRPIAHYLNAHPPRLPVLVDASVAAPLPLFMHDPGRLALTNDGNFRALLKKPWGNVSYILVPEPTFDTLTRSDILRRYPGMYEGGLTWATPVESFAGVHKWRLLQISSEAP